MYTPRINLMDNRQEAVDFMQQYSFATIVTVANGVPSATHLPFVVEQRGEQLVLISHFAKQNHQSQDILNCRPLVIFAEPHAYISPKHYEKELDVPTWNYIAVHAYGAASLILDEEAVTNILEKTISFYEADYLAQWNNLPPDFKYGLIKGIVAFEITVNELQGKKKLSQNKTGQEKQNIIETLSKSGDTNERQIAAYMAALNKKD